MASSSRFRPSVLARGITATVVAAAVALAPLHQARADEVSSSGKGIAGGALLGAEVVTIVESIAGVHAGWAYAIGAVAGAAGGGVGGYFIEKGSKDGQVPMYMLAGGLALVIPAIVLTLNGTRYMPEEGATEDRTPVGPPAEPGAPGGSVVAPGAPVGAGAPTDQPGAATPPAPAPTTPATTPAPAPAPAPSPAPTPPPQSLLDLHRGDFRLGVPVPGITQSLSSAEMRDYGMTRQGAELRMPVLHVAF